VQHNFFGYIDMDKKKIQKLSNKVRKMHFNPEHKERISPERLQMLRDFWEYHVKPVVVTSRKLAKKYGADDALVWIGALVHDISLVDDGKMHDELSAEKAYSFLLYQGFSKEVAGKAKEIALRHRCQKYMPETLEEKIVATADAMNHFMPSYYLGIAVIASQDYAEIMRKNIERLEYDFENKIFFPDEKKEIKRRIDEFKRWFGS
jgi:HD superfamily phosphodiesterase